jgi:hypothetical protein
LLFGLFPLKLAGKEEMEMTPSPVVVGLTLCDYVIVEERTKKVSLIGTFTGLSVPELPAQPLPFSVFAVLTDAEGDGTVELKVRSLDTDEEVYSFQNSLHFPDKLTEVLFSLRIRQILFPVSGYYEFTLLVDGEWVAGKRLHVYQREEQP